MLRVRRIQAVPEEGHGEDGGLRQGHADREAHAALQEGSPYFRRLTEKAPQEDPVEDPQHGQRQAEEGDAGIHPGGVAGDGEALAQEGEGHRRQHLHQLEEDHEKEAALHQVPLPQGQQGEEKQVLILPCVRKGKEEAQAAVEKHHVIGVVRDQQHGGESQEDPVGGMDHQFQLVPQEISHASPPFSRCTMMSSRLAGLPSGASPVW